MRRMHTPEQPKDRFYSALGFPARCLFNAIIDLSDDEGFFQCDASFLQAECFPYDSLTKEDVQKLREEIQNVKQNRPMILVFTLKNGIVVEEFGWLPQWFKHQSVPDYPKVSEIANLLIKNKLLKPSFNSGMHQKIRRMQEKRKLARRLYASTEEKSSRREEKRKEVKGEQHFSFSSSQSQNPDQNQTLQYEPGPAFCPACKKPMADESDKWFCPDCQIRKDKRKVKT